MTKPSELTTKHRLPRQTEGILAIRPVFHNIENRTVRNKEKFIFTRRLDVLIYCRGCGMTAG